MDTPNASFFYLRKYNSKDRGFHRFGCIAIGKTANPTVLTVAYSLLAPGDKFSSSYARTSAVGRLNSAKHSINIPIELIMSVSFPSPLNSLLNALKIVDKITYNHPGIDLAKCGSALKGALIELQPKAQAATG